MNNVNNNNIVGFASYPVLASIDVRDFNFQIDGALCDLPCRQFAPALPFPCLPCSDS